MAAWAQDDLNRFGAAEKIEIAAVRQDGTGTQRSVPRAGDLRICSVASSQAPGIRAAGLLEL